MIDIDVDELTGLLTQVRYWLNLETAAAEAVEEAEFELGEATLRRAEAQSKLRNWIDAQVQCTSTASS